MALLFLLFLLPAAAGAQRVTQSLNGVWDAADSIAGDSVPTVFPHKAPVPGLAHSATPPFPDVDRFDSQENIDREIRGGALPASARVEAVGVPRQKRNYFWFRTRFRAPERKANAILRVGKAQFGTAVWLNGAKIGEYNGCFTASYFPLGQNLRDDNELVIRTGAHPAVLPESVPAGTDKEKRFWTPGIYDNVSLILADNPVIEWVQAAPRLATSDIVVETRLHNYGAAGTFTIWQQVGKRNVKQSVSLGEGETKNIRQTLRIPNPTLWTPETPHLYTLETFTPGDSLRTRFGMREFRFDTATRRAYLNGKLYYLRGSNVTLHRFFEDGQSGVLPWDEKWVRRLLVDIPKQMHWNAFRFCIGPVPDLWLEIADEAGLLIQNEFFIWGWRKPWDTREVIREFEAWMRDNWNHPSVAIWDADNETHADELASVIRAVRPLDLSNRPWDNGYNMPVGPDDPVEDHPYLFSRLGKGFEVPELERMTGAKSVNSPHPSAHAVILNEYGWLWLNRDGSPTELTKRVYGQLAGENASAQQRFALNAYYLAGLTEFWRAHRNFAGVLHFVYLTSSYPQAYTSDHFVDVTNLTLEPHFADYVKEAFRPLGVYLNFWQPRLTAGEQRRFSIVLVNDEYQVAEGRLALTVHAGDGAEIARAEAPFSVAAFGQQTCQLDLRIPERLGRVTLRAAASPGGNKPPTVSRRTAEIHRPVPPGR